MLTALICTIILVFCLSFLVGLLMGDDGPSRVGIGVVVFVWLASFAFSGWVFYLLFVIAQAVVNKN